MLRASLWRRLGTRGLHSSGLCPAIQLKMPSLSPTMETGTIVAWAKKEGEALSPGDVLCEIQTDKAVMAFEVDEEGTLAKILAPDGTSDIPVGQLIAVIAEEGEDWQAVEIPSAAAASAPAPSKSSSDAPPPSATATPAPSSSSSSGRNDMMGPAVKLLLSQHGLDPSQVPHSGPHGLLLKGDVLQHIQATGSSPQPVQPSQAAATTIASPATSAAESGDGFTDIPLSSMRKIIAKRLCESKATSPHAYARVDVTMDAVDGLRSQLKAKGMRVSVNDFIVKAVAVALRAVPALNVRIGPDLELTQQTDVSVSVAVATPSGLITPIVPGADGLSVSEISAKIRELAGRAKEGKLAPAEYLGGSISVSNLGMFGISEFTAIINPPQAAILAVGGARPRLRPGTTQPFSEVRMNLCFDQRGIGQDSAAAFLTSLKSFLEQPEMMLLGVPPASAQVDEMGLREARQ